MYAALTGLQARERWIIAGIAAVGLALRLWALGAKGLAYDEAATALMARASGPEILQFHWQAAFEHPPLWQWTMRAWSTIFGQSEAMLRLLPALAGALAVPLTWYWLRLLWPRAVGRRLLASGLVATSPALVLYAQEARMYTVVVLLALLSLITLVDLVARPAWGAALLFAAINTLLLGYHYYSLLLVGCEALFLLLVWVWRVRHQAPERHAPQSQGTPGPTPPWQAPHTPPPPASAWAPGRWRVAAVWAGALAASIIPIALWMGFSPGFRATFTIVTGSIGSGLSAAQFFDGIWRDLSFGAFRWQPPTAAWGYLLAPLVILGAAVLLAHDFAWGKRNLAEGKHNLAEDTHNFAGGKEAAGNRSASGLGGAWPWGWLVALVGLLPLAVSVLLFRTLAARYILFVLPAIYTLAAAGIVWLGTRGRQHTPAAKQANVPTSATSTALGLVLGSLGLLLAAAPVVLGLGHYFGPYEKSAYREMAAYLRQNLAQGEALLLYAPRQHLLAKYYLGEDRPFYTAPQVELPRYWPVNAPPVVPEEMDGQIQDLLAAHDAVWLLMTAQDEVDDGEFVPKYLAAVAYKQECQKWIDVELCRFVSPHSVAFDAAGIATANAGAPSGQTGHTQEFLGAGTPDLLYNGELRLAQAQALRRIQPAGQEEQGLQPTAQGPTTAGQAPQQAPAQGLEPAAQDPAAAGPAPEQAQRQATAPLLPQETIYVQLDWLAERKPSVDYRVTLRLEDATGQVVAQRDEFPIGPLLPPTTWNEGDAKPGYMALVLPAGLPQGEYRLTVNVYNPATGATYAQPLELARLQAPG